MPSQYNKSLLVTLLEHKEYIHLPFTPKSVRAEIQMLQTIPPHFPLLLICDDDFLRKGTETCQICILVGKTFGCCEHFFLLIISATSCHLPAQSLGCSQFWYYLQFLLPLWIMQQLHNVAEECELNPKQDVVVAKAYEQCGLWALREI